MYKLQVQDDDGEWTDVKGDHGQLLTFEDEEEARSKLKQLYPVLVGLEEYAVGRKRTRVIVMEPYKDIDEDR